MKNIDIILASNSPRRKELLKMINIPFRAITADIVENIDFSNDLTSEIEKLSYQKAKAVFDKNPQSLVIGSDTIVSLNNEVLGKPHSYQQAKEMLEKLSDNCHHVITAVTILYQDKVETFHSISKVYFYPLTEKEIDDYINTGEPMDKAGAYGIQGLGAKFIKSINGDFYTVMGLPVSELYHRLDKYIN